MNKRKTILIIGGTGFLGFHIAKKCLSLSFKVISLSLRKPKKQRKINKIKYIKYDLSKKITKQLEKYNFDYVINCGGYVEHKNKKKIINGHFKIVKNLYNYFKNKNIKLFIQIGSSAEYGDTKIPHKESYSCKPKGIYGKYKLKASNFLLQKFKKNKFPVCILRLYQLFGSNQDINRFIPILIKSCLKQKKFFMSNGNQKRDFLYIKDAVKAIIKTIYTKKSIGEIINIGYGQSFELNKIVEYVFKKTNFNQLEKNKIKMRADEKLNIYPDITKARKILSWSPKTKLFRAIIKTIRFYKNNTI